MCLYSITAKKNPQQPSFVFRSFSLLLSDSSVSAAVKPLPCSAGHINPAGLWLYGSPAHTSVMRVNKQRAKGQQSPQNKEGRRGRHREKREQARGSAQITVRASSRRWCTRQQPRTGNDYKQRTGETIWEKRGCIVFICQICCFFASDSVTETCTKKKKRALPLTDRDGLIAASAFIGLTQEKWGTIMWPSAPPPVLLKDQWGRCCVNVGFYICFLPLPHTLFSLVIKRTSVVLVWISSFLYSRCSHQGDTSPVLSSALGIIPLWLWRWIRAKLGRPNLF